MGAILLIEDDHNVQNMLAKIFPEEELKAIKKFSMAKEKDREVLEEKPWRQPTSSIYEDAMRQLLKEQIQSQSTGGIYEPIIGKVEKALIGIVLEEAKGNQVRAARKLGINRNTLRKKIKDLGITTRVITS